MKLTVSFTFETDGTFYAIEDKEDAPAVLQELGSLFGDFQAKACMEKLRLMANKDYSKEMKKALISHIEEKEKLLTQLFTDYKVEGETKDGHSFVFTHKEPGYKETMQWDDDDSVKNYNWK